MHEFQRIPFELTSRNNEFKFYKLLVDGRCQFDEFLNELEKDVRSKKILYRIIALMDSFSVRFMLPKTKFRHLEIPDIPNIYEFKKDLLRVYVLKDNMEFTIILGGFKANQKKDIERVRRLIKDYK